MASGIQALLFGGKTQSFPPFHTGSAGWVRLLNPYKLLLFPRIHKHTFTGSKVRRLQASCIYNNFLNNYAGVYHPHF